MSCSQQQTSAIFSGHNGATRDIEYGAGDPGCFIRRKKERSLCYVLLGSEALDRMVFE